MHFSLLLSSPRCTAEEERNEICCSLHEFHHHRSRFWPSWKTVTPINHHWMTEERRATILLPSVFATRTWLPAGNQYTLLLLVAEAVTEVNHRRVWGPGKPHVIIIRSSWVQRSRARFNVKSVHIGNLLLFLRGSAESSIRLWIKQKIIAFQPPPPPPPLLLIILACIPPSLSCPTCLLATPSHCPVHVVLHDPSWWWWSILGKWSSSSSYYRMRLFHWKTRRDDLDWMDSVAGRNMDFKLESSLLHLLHCTFYLFHSSLGAISGCSLTYFDIIIDVE